MGNIRPIVVCQGDKDSRLLRIIISPVLCLELSPLPWLGQMVPTVLSGLWHLSSHSTIYDTKHQALARWGVCADSGSFPSSGGKTLSAARVMARSGNRAITGGFSDDGSPCFCTIFGKVAESTGARTCQLSRADTTWQRIPENVWRTGGLAEWEKRARFSPAFAAPAKGSSALSAGPETQRSADADGNTRNYSCTRALNGIGG